MILLALTLSLCTMSLSAADEPAPVAGLAAKRAQLHQLHVDHRTAAQEMVGLYAAMPAQTNPLGSSFTDATWDAYQKSMMLQTMITPVSGLAEAKGHDCNKVLCFIEDDRPAVQAILDIFEALPPDAPSDVKFPKTNDCVFFSIEERDEWIDAPARTEEELDREINLIEHGLYSINQTLPGARDAVATALATIA